MHSKRFIFLPIRVCLVINQLIVKVWKMTRSALTWVTTHETRSCFTLLAMNLWRYLTQKWSHRLEDLVLVLGVGKTPCHFVSLLISGSRQSRRERTEMLRGTITIYKIMIRLQAGRASSDLGWWSTLAGEERLTRHTVTGISSSHQYKLITTTKLPVKYWTSQENDIISSLIFCCLRSKSGGWSEEIVRLCPCHVRWLDH